MDFELPSLQVDSVLNVTTSDDVLVINRDPCPSETWVAVDSTIALDVTSFGGDALALATLRVFVDGVLATFYSGGAVQIQAAFAGPRSSASFASPTQRIVLDPVAGLPSLGTVEVVVEASTASGDTLREVYSFSIEDRTGPRVLSALALDQTTVRVEFNESVAVSVSPGFVLAAMESPAVVPVVSSVAISGRQALLTLDTELSPDITYQVEATGIVDLYGNVTLPAYDTAFFEGFVAPRPHGRLYDSLWEMLPRHNRRDDETGDLQRIFECLQDAFSVLLWSVDRWVEIFDYERAPEAFVDLILRDLGNPFSFDLTLTDKRRLASVLVDMYQQKGTEPGLRNAIRFFMGLEVTVDGFVAQTLTLGVSELGVDWELGTHASWPIYAFNVVSPVTLTAEQRTRIRAIVNYLKPGHTHFVELIEPDTAPPYVAYHWEIGESELGESTFLHSIGETPVPLPPLIAGAIGTAEGTSTAEGVGSSS